MASSKITLLPYQEQCVKFIQTHRGLILYHSMGSGKTITSIAMAIQFPNPIVIIATKSSKKNFKDDLEKMAVTDSVLNRIQITTYKKAVMIIEENKLNFRQENIVIIDEAHRLRKSNQIYE